MINPLLYLDAYKTCHHKQYPKGITKVVSNITARSSRIADVESVVFFGLQAYIKEWLQGHWLNLFTDLGDDMISEYEEMVRTMLNDPTYSADHIRELKKLGYMPLAIRALPEATLVPIRVPMLCIENTHPDFAWLPNFLETQISSEVWGLITNSTIAFEYKKKFLKYAMETDPENAAFVMWQGHDFSMRGIRGCQAASASGGAHLLSFYGTDTVPAIKWAQVNYGAPKFVGGSVSATEHSVMCTLAAVMVAKAAIDLEIPDEYESIRYLIQDVHPSGIVALVSDSYDFWNVVSTTLPRLKDIILGRNGKVVIRPDSGDPVLILCGDPQSSDPFVKKGLVECLWDIFGGTISSKGFKKLNEKIGAIYGDSITLDRQSEILRRLAIKGFASTNVVLGIGSYTYQYNTRDTFGLAMKATYCVVNDKPYNIYKKPKTDNGIKNSIKGLPLVKTSSSKGYVVMDEVGYTDYDSPVNDLILVYRNGQLEINHNFEALRIRINHLALTSIGH